MRGRLEAAATAGREREHAQQLSGKEAQLSALERETSRCRCGSCGQTYRQPLVSTHCWHVHCAQCWHTALAADGRCPQCSALVASDDLNAIHV